MWDQALVAQLDLDHVRGAREAGLGGGLIAQLEVEGDVARRIVVHLCGAFGGGSGRVRDGIERLVVDLDEIGGVARLIPILGDHDGNAIADMAHHIDRQHGMSDRLEVGQQPPHGHHPGESRSLYVLRGENSHHSGCGFGLGGVDAADPGVGIGRANDRRVQHVGRLEVVRVPALAGDEGGILPPPNRCA